MNCLIKTLQSYMLSAMEVIISVPKDLTVVSFENSYYSSGPANITSLGHSEKELVNKTTEAVISAIEHKSYSPEPIKWKLHVRNSG